MPLGKKLIDDDNARSALVVALFQQPAFFHARSQHFQIAGRHFAVESVVKLARGHGGLTFDGVAFGIDAPFMTYAVNGRPTIGWTPRTSKKFGVTFFPESCSG